MVVIESRNLPGFFFLNDNYPLSYDPCVSLFRVLHFTNVLISIFI